jgi:hypothetical protein
MSFWESEIGEVTGKAEDAFAKQFSQIPDGTKAIAKIQSFTNQEHKDSGFRYLNIEWILQEGDFRGQKVQQKLKVYGGDKFDRDPVKTRHRALNMLKLLYELYKMKPKHSNPPTDQDLASFVGKIAGIKIRETQPNDNGRQYNWISEVHASQGFKSETGMGLPMLAHATINNHVNQNVMPPDLLDDVPF